MDTAFLEFWGKFLINVAQGQKQLDEMSTWMRRGYADADDLANLFRSCYGLNAPDTASTQDPRAWQDAVAEFQNTFAQFAAQWGWVPRAEHQQALDKCADLEQQVQTQQETIRQLRELLAHKGLGYNELLQHMQGYLKDQSDQFQRLMDNVLSAFKEKP